MQSCRTPDMSNVNSADANSADSAPLLFNGSLEDAEWYQGAKVVYTWPAFRAATMWILVLVIDCISSIVLWLTGGDTDYFFQSVTDFGITTSVFDLTVISIVQFIILLTLIVISENAAVSALYFNQTALPKWIILAAIVSAGSCIYSLVKGGLLLNAFVRVTGYSGMHATYNALMIVSVVLRLVECLLVGLTYHQLKRVRKIVVKRIFDSNGAEVDKDGKPIKKSANLRRLISLARPEVWLLTAGCVCLLVTSGTSIIAPYFFGQVVDAAQKSMSDLNRTIVILFLIYCLYSVAAFLRAWVFELAGMKLVARIRIQLFSAITRQDIEFFDITRTGELTNRLSSDTQVIQSAITANISMLLRNGIMIVGSLVVMFVLEPALTGILLAVVPFISVGAVQYGRFCKSLRKSFQDKLADASTVAEESISSMRTVRAFNGEAKATAGYAKNIDRSYEVAKKIALAEGLFNGLVSIASFGAITLAMWYGGKLVFEGELTVGILTSFLVYTVQIAGCLAVLASLYGDFMQAVGASERMFELMDKKPKIVSTNPTHPTNFLPMIEFKDVHFTYPSRPDYEVLKGLSLAIEPGKVVALVGPSGGGKSTIVSLIERFYDVTAGAVLISGVNLQNLDPLWFRTKMSLVSQEPTLFACSIEENIAYGIEASPEQVQEAAKLANAHSFIEAFPEGYHTLVGERGVRLSGGQKQRVAIARSLIINPAILLLDEATSALDAESEQLVQEAIDRAMQGRTVLIIAHRLSTVRNAAKVIVIDKGIIAEQGTHEELVKRDGVYKKLVLKQLEAGNTVHTLDSD